MRWGLQKDFVILPKSVTKSRIEENKKLYDFELDKEDMKALDLNVYEPCAWGTCRVLKGLIAKIC